MTRFAVVAVVVGFGLRAWDLDRAWLSFDEAFTATAARLPVGDLLTFLRHNDSHPPLDYLMRKPLAALAPTEAVLRIPSVILTTAALAALAWWLRDRGRLGALTIGLMAIAPMQLAHGQEARMYAGMIAVGVVCAIAADRWLREPSNGATVAVGIALLLGLFLHVSTLLLAAGLFWLPGLRRDAVAWRWRLAVVAPVAVWGVLWGPSFLDQLDRRTSGWVPFTSLDGAARTINELVNHYPTLSWIVLPAVAVGGAALFAADRRLFRVWCVTFVVPAAVAMVLGTRLHLLLPRTLAFAAWAPLAALAALIDQATARWRMLGVAAAAGVALLVLPSTFVRIWQEPAIHQAVMTEIGDAARPNDGVVVHPRFLGPLVEWYFDVRRPGPQPRLRVRPDQFRGVVLGRQWNGRIWLMEHEAYRADLSEFTPCAPPRPVGAYRLHCLDRNTLPRE